MAEGEGDEGGKEEDDEEGGDSGLVAHGAEVLVPFLGPSMYLGIGFDICGAGIQRQHFCSVVLLLFWYIIVLYYIFSTAGLVCC